MGVLTLQWLRLNLSLLHSSQSLRLCTHRTVIFAPWPLVRSNAHLLPHSSGSWDVLLPSSLLASELLTELPSLESELQTWVSCTERAALDVLGVAHVHERLARAVVGVEDLLQHVEHQVGGAVRAVVLLDVRVLDLMLGREARAAGGERDDLLSSHAPC